MPHLRFHQLEIAHGGARPSLLRPRLITLVAAIGALLMLVACAPMPVEEAGDSPDSNLAMSATEEALVIQAMSALADELGVDADAIEVTSIEAVEWGDSSLGCPEEGMMYAAVITPGYQITLTHDGLEYIYHTGADADGPVIQCPADAEASTPETGTESPAGSAEEQLLVNLAKQDLAGQLGVDTDAIEVKSVKTVEWSDSSLGCPEEGMMYAQALTPGYQITLTYDGTDYVYHTGENAASPIINCTDATDSTSADGRTEPAAGSTEAQLVALAKEDLAAQLDVDAATIDVKSVEAVEWSDSSLGCPQEGMMYAQVITPGYQITLTHDGADYVYHTGADGDSLVINCTEDQSAADAADDTEESAPMLTTRETLVARAIDDLVQRQGVEPSAIEVKSTRGVEWRDGSLGCAKAGMMYPQVITPGYRITLSVNGVDYAYHTSGRKDGPVKYCNTPQKSTDGASQSE